MTKQQYKEAQRRAAEYLNKAGLAVTDTEKENIEVAFWGFNDLERVGLQILTYVNTERVCAKELVMFPGQTCIQHIHPPTAGGIGKEETFRCRWGEVYLYVPGEETKKPKAIKPPGHEPYLTCPHEIKLGPGEQYTLTPDTWHWFQAGKEGAVVSEFSTHSFDEADIFTDPRAVRYVPLE